MRIWNGPNLNKKKKALHKTRRKKMLSKIENGAHRCRAMPKRQNNWFLSDEKWTSAHKFNENYTFISALHRPHRKCIWIKQSCNLNFFSAESIANHFIWSGNVLQSIGVFSACLLHQYHSRYIFIHASWVHRIIFGCSVVFFLSVCW